MPDAVQYLNSKLGWAAAYHPAFADFAGDIRRLRTRLARVTHTDDTPDTGSGVTCLDCDTTLRRQWTDQGLSDDWDCKYCGRRYTHAEYGLAAHRHMDDQQTPDGQLLTISDIRGRVDLGPNVVHVWQQRGLIVSHGKDPAGRNLYRWADVRKLLDTRRTV